jgi:hypothetical protein
LNLSFDRPGTPAEGQVFRILMEAAGSKPEQAQSA